MRAYFDESAGHVVIETYGHFHAKSLEAYLMDGRVAVKLRTNALAELFLNAGDVQRQDGTAAGASATEVIDYLNGEFEKVPSAFFNGLSGSYTPLLLVSSALTISLFGSATEISDSRRLVDFSNSTLVRAQFIGASAITIRIEYSTNGTTWQTLIDSSACYSTNPCRTDWLTIPSAIRADGVLLRAMALGSGLSLSLSFVQVDFG